MFGAGEGMTATLRYILPEEQEASLTSNQLDYNMFKAWEPAAHKGLRIDRQGSGFGHLHSASTLAPRSPAGVGVAELV